MELEDILEDAPLPQPIARACMRSKGKKKVV